MMRLEDGRRGRISVSWSVIITDTRDIVVINVGITDQILVLRSDLYINISQTRSNRDGAG